jgi:hypothetical protein
LAALFVGWTVTVSAALVSCWRRFDTKRLRE